MYFGTFSGAEIVALDATATSLDCVKVGYSVQVTATNAEGIGNINEQTIGCPALSLSKTADEATVSGGSGIGFTLALGNAASAAGTAEGTMLSDTLPNTGAPWTVASDSTNSCSISGNALSCPIGNMAPGTSGTVDVTSSPVLCGQFTNTALATTTNNASLASNQAATTVLCPGLNVTTVPDASPISADNQAGFTTTVSVAASGTAPSASDVSLSQPLPGDSSTSWIVDPASQAASACAISGAPGAQTLSCSFAAIAAGSSEAVHVTSVTTAGSCQNYTATASVSAANYAAASSSANLVIECPALTLTKAAAAAQVASGNPIGFTMTMANSNQAGTGVAFNPVITDALPAGGGINWTIVNPSSACAISGVPPSQSLSCTVSQLNPGDSLSVQVQANSSGGSCGTYSNTAQLAADNAPSQSASDSTVVLCPALQISKSAVNATVSAGDTVSYNILVMNSAAAGTASAAGVSISDTLPANAGLNWSTGTPGLSNQRWDLVVQRRHLGGGDQRDHADHLAHRPDDLRHAEQQRQRDGGQ
jgi:uncharacterized repeat protein (TIGR01451 family)